MIRAAVTGGAGQLGTLVLRRLCADRGVGEVRCIDLRPPLAASPKLKPVQADVRDPDFARHLQGCDVLVHLAFLVARRGKRAGQDEVNVEGSKNVFRAALRAGVPRIVYASSIAAYGVVPGHGEPLVETSPRIRQPSFWYACAKYDVEAFLDELEAAHPEVAIARLRPAILLGRRMEHALGAAFRRGALPDSGPVPFPVVWDEDVADAFVLAAKSDARGAFNLAADEPVPTRRLAEAAGLRTVPVPIFVRKALIAADALAGKLGLIPPMDPGWFGAGEARMIASSERARRELKWKPRYARALEVARRQVEAVPRKLDRRLSLFFRVVDRASRREPPRPDLAGYETTIHLELSGPNGGDVTLRAHGGRLAVREGAPRPADGAVFLSAQLLLELLTGKTDFASAQITGRIRTEGQGLASLVLGGMIGGFQAATRAPGFAGRAARVLGAWMRRP